MAIGLQFAHTPTFYGTLGQFYAVWNRTELTIDCAIWALGTGNEEQAHVDSAGLKFSDKCKQLRTLIGKDKIRNGERIIDLLTQIEGSLRNAFAHSFLASDVDSVVFIHRKVERDGKYQAKAHKFTSDEFAKYVQSFVELSVEFQQALELTNDQVADFAAYALPLSTQAE